MSNKNLKVLITLLLVIAILLIGLFIYKQVINKGVDTVISGVKEVKEKDTPEIKKPDVIEKSDVGVVKEPDPIDEPEEDIEDKPSIIVDNPIRREQEDTKRDDNYIQPDEFVPAGTVLGDVGTVEIISEVEDVREEELAERQKELQERAERNKGRILVGLEVALFENPNGDLLDTENILNRGSVIIPWFANDEKSVEYTKLLNKIYTDYTEDLNVIFLCERMADKDNVEKVMKDNGFTFNIYYDASASFLSITNIRNTTEVLFVNEDDYIVHRFTQPVDEESLRTQFDKLINKEY